MRVWKREASMNKRSANAGISLIEVLVVIVLLLVGIMSVVRLFPPGLLINKQVEAATLAARLANQEKDRYAATSTNLMDAVVPVLPVGDSNSPTGYILRMDLDATPDDLGEAPRVINGVTVDPYYFSDVNRQRWIKGETVRIPSPSPILQGVRGSIYMLNAGPIFDPWGEQWQSRPDQLAITGSPLYRRVQEAQDPSSPYLNNPAVYAIDYDDRVVAFYPAGYARTFQLTYSYYDAGNSVQTVASQTLSVPASTAPAWISIGSPGTVVPGSDTVSRGFTRLSYPPTWSADPYEYCVPPRTSSVASYAGVGVVIFNPGGRDYVERSAYGNLPLTAKIDYSVLDWHILREDRPMPSTAPYTVRLTLPNIKKLGDSELDQSEYTGIWRDSSAPQVDLLAYNIATGEEVPSSEFKVNYKEGAVTFTDGYGSANASGNYRFFYKARGDWALQVQKAANVYHRAPSHTANLGFAEYYLGGGTSGGRATRLYLPLMEAGKTVTLRDVWYYASSGSGPAVLKRSSNETYRVNADPAQFENLGAGALTWVDLAENHSSGGDTATGWALDQSVEPAGSVTGISFRSRVIWARGGGVQATTAGNVARVRWNKVDVETFLTRSAN